MHSKAPFIPITTAICHQEALFFHNHSRVAKPLIIRIKYTRSGLAYLCSSGSTVVLLPENLGICLLSRLKFHVPMFWLKNLPGFMEDIFMLSICLSAALCYFQGRIAGNQRGAPTRNKR